jgi:hypothetical protein
MQTPSKTPRNALLGTHTPGPQHAGQWTTENYRNSYDGFHAAKSRFAAYALGANFGLYADLGKQTSACDYQAAAAKTGAPIPK